VKTTPAGWTIVDRDAKVLAYSYNFTAEGRSTTFVAPMADGKLMVVSPSTTLPDAAAAELAGFGEVGAIVANNGWHYMGQKLWRERYPDARCFAPKKGIERIAKKSKYPLDFEPIEALAPLLGEGVGFRDVPETKSGETWFWAQVAGGYAWYTSDVLANMPGLPGNFIVRSLFKLTKSGPGYSVFRLAMKFIVKDPKAALRLMLEDVEAHPPAVVVPAHGDILEGGDIAERTRALIRAAI